jgi:hypothetical protein
VKRRLGLALVLGGLLLLAVGGWAVEAVRWTLTGSRERLQPA